MSSDAARGGSAEQDPIEYFLDELTFHGRSERTCDAYRRVLRQYETFLNKRGRVLAEATRRDCMAWVHDLRGPLAPSTVATYASYVHRFYGYMVEVGQFDHNPMAIVTEEMDERVDTDPTRRDISVDEMRSFVRGIRHPLDRVVVITLLKTGMRVGELCNLDLQDLHLNDVSESVVGDSRGPLVGRGDSLYVAAEPSRGAETNGEIRTASNKRKRDTIVPVDDELRRELVRWLAIRPDPRSEADPLFASTREWGRRLTPGMVRSAVVDYAKEEGWYREGAERAENVTPHYFRHFFTTHLRDRTGDRGIVKYLRGDVAGDIVDTYTHNWGDRVRTVYEDHIYSVV